MLLMGTKVNTKLCKNSSEDISMVYLRRNTFLHLRKRWPTFHRWHTFDIERKLGEVKQIQRKNQ